ncbi:MAG: hypothetical protein KKH33_07010 [Alphaproteobacteria bacterium]|nr:hypothetical protein [Alphaproteobacteria bacterium]
MSDSTGRWVKALMLAVFCTTPAVANETQTYKYDALGRLVKSQHSGSINNGVQTTYTYDRAGNRSHVQVIGGAIVPQCFYSVGDNLTGQAGNVLQFKIVRSGPDCWDNAEIYYSFTDGTAVQNQHFSSQGSHVQFSPASAAEAYIYVNTFAGVSSSPVEFTVTLSEANDNDEIVDGTAVGRINPPSCVFAPANSQVTAGYYMSFQLIRTGSCAPDQTVQFFTSDQDAVAGVHYVAASGNATFPGNATFTTVNIATISGSVAMGEARYFRLNVSSSNPGIQPQYPSSPYASGRIYAPGDD